MSQPHEPVPDPAGGTERVPETGPGGGRTEQPPPQAGPQPPTESEPAPSAASPSEAAEAPRAPEPQPVGPAGHYVWVPATPPRRFGPALNRFVRNRATHLVAAVVVGAIIGGGTVAIVDNAANHDRSPQFSREGHTGGPFGGSDRRFPGYFVGPGGQGSGN